MLRIIAFVVTLLLGPAAAAAEQVPPPWARGLGQEYLSLQAGDLPFGARISPAVGEPKGALLLLPDVGDHPASSPGAALHQELPTQGWTVLSIEPPALDSLGFTGFVAALPARIQAARAALSDRGITRLVLAGHGLGALAAANYANSEEGAGVERLLLLSMPAYPERDASLDAADLVGQLKIPALDLYGDRDSAAVTGSAEARRRAAARSGMVYRQVVLPAADHRYTRHAAPLLKRLRAWLEP